MRVSSFNDACEYGSKSPMRVSLVYNSCEYGTCQPMRVSFLVHASLSQFVSRKFRSDSSFASFILKGEVA